MVFLRSRDGEADDSGTDSDPGVDGVGFSFRPAEVGLHSRQQGAEETVVKNGNGPSRQRHDGGDVCVSPGEFGKPPLLV